MEFIVSGEPLQNIIKINPTQLITPFGWGANKEYEKEVLHIFTFRRKPHLETGRVMLYVCRACGGIDCGAVTAKILDAGANIVWKDFGYETGYEGISELFHNIEPITFERQSYFQAFSKLK